MSYQKNLEVYEKREVTYNYPNSYYYRYSPLWREWRWRDWRDWPLSDWRWVDWKIPEIKFPEIKWPEAKATLPLKKTVTWHSDLSQADSMLKSVSLVRDTPRTSSIVIRLTSDQEAILQEQFRRWPRVPYHADIVLLAAETGLTEAEVKDWYAIRLAQWRKEQGLGSLGLF
ncbi:uncharacterized protein [Prorops nasuta]|uniref:uncharacterized protein n=1 Tax=Prorops nasuta TaxID=863751 RepID=UPI0034CE1CDD